MGLGTKGDGPGRPPRPQLPSAFPPGFPPETPRLGWRPPPRTDGRTGGAGVVWVSGSTGAQGCPVEHDFGMGGGAGGTRVGPPGGTVGRGAAVAPNPPPQGGGILAFWLFPWGWGGQRGPCSFPRWGWPPVCPQLTLGLSPAPLSTLMHPPAPLSTHHPPPAPPALPMHPPQHPLWALELVGGWGGQGGPCPSTGTPQGSCTLHIPPAMHPYPPPPPCAPSVSPRPYAPLPPPATHPSPHPPAWFLCPPPPVSPATHPPPEHPPSHAPPRCVPQSGLCLPAMSPLAMSAPPPPYPPYSGPCPPAMCPPHALSPHFRPCPQPCPPQLCPSPPCLAPHFGP